MPPTGVRLGRLQLDLDVAPDLSVTALGLINHVRHISGSADYRIVLAFGVDWAVAVGRCRQMFEQKAVAVHR